MLFVTVGAQHEPGFKEFSFGFMVCLMVIPAGDLKILSLTVSASS